MLQFFSFGSHDMNHSNFENATKYCHKSWWYLFKWVQFILKLSDFCNTCENFQREKTNNCRLNQSTVFTAHAWVAMTNIISWWNCIIRVARIEQFPHLIMHETLYLQQLWIPARSSLVCQYFPFILLPNNILREGAI